IGNHEAPEKITLDGSQASHQAVAELKTEGVLPGQTLVRTSKYLNNMIEQDHRRVKHSNTAQYYSDGQGRSPCHHHRPRSSFLWTNFPTRSHHFFPYKTDPRRSSSGRIHPISPHFGH